MHQENKGKRSITERKIAATELLINEETEAITKPKMKMIALGSVDWGLGPTKKGKHK